LTKPARTWHLCDGSGATTWGHWTTEAELKAAMRAAYGETIPTLLGRPCNRPLIPRGYRHLVSTEEPTNR
jgi:hypothetical protein